MNKKFTIGTLFIALFLGSISSLNAQLKHEWKETLTGGTTYCPGDAPYDNWKTHRNSLDTSIYKYTKVTMQGSISATAITGRTCNDFDIVRKLAHAYKNGINYSATCNGNRWRVENGCQATGCVAAVNDVMLDCDGNNTSCACANRWIIRMGIGNANWGGVDATSCPSANQTMQVTFEYPGPFNNMNVVMADPDKCNYTQDLTAKFTNASLKKVDSFIYHYKIGNTVFGPIKILSNLGALKDTTIKIKVNHTFTAQTPYNFTTFITKVNTTPDSSKFGDTSRISGFFSGNPGVPSAFDDIVCGSGRTLLKCNPNNPGDSITWYVDKAATQLIGPGKNALSPFLYSGQTYKFWAYASSGIENAKISTANGNYVGTGGQMFDLKVLNTMFIDSLDLHINSYNTEAYEIYIREGSYTDPGATTTSGMWTLAQSGNVTANGYGNKSPLPFKYNLSAGKTYGVYITLTGSTAMVFTLSANTVSNSDVILTAGSSVNYPFTGAFANRTWNGTIHYRKALCTGPGDSAMIEVRTKPWGASLTETAGFQKAPKKGGDGTAGRPHVVALGDELRYDFVNPNGFTTAGLGTNWEVTNVALRSEKNRNLNGGTNWSWTAPAGTTAGRLTYTPDSAMVDSSLTICITVRNIATTCDSTICTNIYVAPLPDPKYTRNTKICDGDVIAFNNLSTIKTGFLEYKWYFGDGDSTDAPNPVKQYATNGTYYSRFNAISSIYGYIRTIRDTIVVTQIPKVDFSIANVCEGQTHTFTNNTTVASGTLTYVWNYGDATTSTNANKVHTKKYLSGSRFIVKLAATANGCSADITKNAYLFPVPVAKIVAPASGILCSNKAVSFGNNSSIVTGNFGNLWNMGDANVKTTKTVSHMYAGPGTYKVKYKAISDFGCFSYDSVNVVIVTSPMADFTVGPACDLSPTDFTNTTTGVGTTTPTYAWNFGDGNTSGAMSPSHQYADLGPKSVKLNVSLDNGCKDEITKMITVRTQPTVDFDVASGCFDKPLPFDNKTTFKTGNINYKWEFGQGAISNIADPVRTFTGTGTQTFNVTLTADVDGFCEVIKVKPVIIYELPKCDFTVTSGWTPGFGFRTINLAAANTTYPSYIYKISDGGVVNGATGTYQFASDGIYDITLIAKNLADCECTKTVKRYQQNSLNTTILDGSKVSVFPNPSTGMVAVVASHNIQTVEVYDMLGHLVKTENGSSKELSLNLSKAANGIYMISVKTEAGTVTKRIVINK